MKKITSLQMSPSSRERMVTECRNAGGSCCALCDTVLGQVMASSRSLGKIHHFYSTDKVSSSLLNMFVYF